MSTSPPTGSSPGGPTALRMIMGGYLRRLREAKGITRDAAGYEIRSSESKISRMELGRVGFKVRDVEDLLHMYGIEDKAEVERLLDLVKEANQPGWWHRYGDALPNWFSAYLDLEGAASMIRSYEVQLIPGLLQTREYARALLMLGFGHTPMQEVEDRINVRLSRQGILDKDQPPILWTVIDEAALCRPFGSRKVMRQQLQALIEACDRPNVKIQIVRFSSTEAYAGAGAPFTWLRFASEDLKDVIYIEHLTSGLYLDRDDEVDAYQAAMEHLCVQAEQPSKTPDILRQIIEEYY